MCIFIAIFGLHGIACVYFCHSMGLSRCDGIFSLGFPFPNNFDEMGSLMQFVWDGQIGFESEWGGSPN